MNEDERKCPRCAEIIKREAKVCRFCGYEFSPEELTVSNRENKEVAWKSHLFKMGDFFGAVDKNTDRARLIVVIVAILFISYCYSVISHGGKGGNSQSEIAQVAGNVEASASSSPPSTGVSSTTGVPALSKFPEVQEVREGGGTLGSGSGRGKFYKFIVVDASRAKPAGFPQLAKEACGAQTWCNVGIWFDKAIAPTSIPFSDQAICTQVYSYAINRTNNFEESLWDCDKYPQDNRDNCLPKDKATFCAEARLRPNPSFKSSGNAPSESAAKSPSSPAASSNDLSDKIDAATVSCGVYSDDYVRDVAKYNFKWDKGLLEFKFDKFLKSERGVITLGSDKLMLQNGFGAYQRVRITCNYDTQQGKVLGFEIAQR